MQYNIKFMLKIMLFSHTVTVSCLSQPVLSSEMNRELVYGKGEYIYGPDIDQWGEDIKQQQRVNGQQFLETLSEAVDEGIDEIRLDKKHYRFSAEHLDLIGSAFITLNDTDNLTIHGNGAQFWFENYLSAIRMENCQNISFLDLTMDWDPLPFSQVVITGIDPEGKYVDGKTEGGFRNLNEILNDPSVRGRPTVKAFIFHAKTGIVKTDTAHSEISSIERIGENQFRYYGRGYGAQDYKSMNVEPGDRMAFVIRTWHGIRIYKSETITFNNVHLYASPFYGIGMGNGGGNLVLKNCKFIPRPKTKRLMSVNGDAVHFITVQKGPRIEGCEFSGAGDDIMNIQGNFSMVQEQRDKKKMVIAIKHHSNIFEGSTIRIYDYNTLQSKGEFRVVNTTEGGAALKQDAKAVGEEKEVKFWPGSNSLICELDKPVDVKRYDIVESDYDGAVGTVVRDNYLHNVTTRGFLVQSKDALIENNTIVNVDNAAIVVLASLKWCEGPISNNVILRKNTIKKPGWTYGSRHKTNSKVGAISVILEYFGELKRTHRPIRNITIENNTILNAGTCGIFMIHSKNNTIRNNTISGFCEVNPWRVGGEYGVKPYSAIYIGDSEQIEITDNMIQNPGPYARDDIIIGKYADKRCIRIER
jgi:parallel beta-helix repeat protein